MSRRDDHVRALAAGRAAELCAANPYGLAAGADRSLVLAKLWMRGYRAAALERFYSRPSMQPYLEARRAY